MKRAAFVLGPWIVLYACSTTSGGAGAVTDASVPQPEPDAAALDVSSPPFDSAPPPDGGRDASPSPVDASSFDVGTGEASSDGAAADAAADAADAAPPPVPAVQYIGRWELSAGEASAAYPASRAVVRFRGTALEVTARDTYNETWIDVTVDGTLAAPILVRGATPRVVSLVDNLPMGDHVVEIYKRTEDFTGILRLSSFSFPGGGQLLAPPPRKARRIEIIGNSTLVGYGVDGVRGAANCSTSAVHNAHRSLIPLLADGLDAEDYAPSASGTGVLTNENPLDTNLLFLTYPRVMSRLTPLWDFSTWQPDAVVVMVGGTDLSNPSVDPPPSQATFAAAYEQFLALVRAKNPNAHVFALTSPTASDFYPVNDVNGVPYMARTKVIGGIAAAVLARNAAGDGRVYPFVFGAASDPEVGACAYHPTFALYQRMASELVPFIKTKVGW